MSRQRVFAVALAVAAVGAAGFAGGRASTDRSVQPTELRDLWHWRIPSVPRPYAKTELQLVARVAACRTALGMPPHPTGPVPPGEGEERVIASDVLADPRSDTRVTLQLLDVRALGVQPGATDVPLRVLAGLRSQGTVTDAPARLDGTTLRGLAVVHAGGWAGDEYPLVTVGSVDADYQYTSTLLLLVVPHHGK